MESTTVRLTAALGDESSETVEFRTREAALASVSFARHLLRAHFDDSPRHTVDLCVTIDGSGDEADSPYQDDELATMHVHHWLAATVA